MTAKRRTRTFWSALLLLTAAHYPLVAQDRFGGSVAVSHGDVLIEQPAASRGPATVYVFRRTDGGDWAVVQRLRPAGSAQTGEGLSPSIGVARNTLFVGAGDPAGRWGAYTFRRTAKGTWVEAEKLALDPDPGTGQNSYGKSVDLAAVMRILRPPSRVVAMNDKLAAVALVGGTGRSSGVRLIGNESGSNGWSEVAHLKAGEMAPNDRFGAALALNNNLVLVGAPSHGGSGAVFVFARERTTGKWQEEAMLRPDSLAPGSGFGTAVLLSRELVLVGAPGTAETRGQLFVFRRDADTERWSELTTLTPAEGMTGDAYGAALAAEGDEVWVGAPGVGKSSGRIHRWVWDETADDLREHATISPQGVEPGFSFGSTIAVAMEVAVAGAPDADGGMGRAVVFPRLDDGNWGEAVWLDSGGDLAAVSGGEVRCTDGRAASFVCSNVDLLAFLPIGSLGGEPGERVSDLWGWTDPKTGAEYALVGRTGGMAVVDITDPERPTYLGLVPGNPSGTRDIKVYSDHAFLTGGAAGDHGLLVFDLTRLRYVQNPPVTFEPDVKYDGIASAHNLAIDTETGFAYPVGASGGGDTCGGGLHMVDIRDPKRPTFAGCYTDTEGLIWQGRTHDAQCVVYHGPDDNYSGRQICFASNETVLRIVDVTDKSSPVPLAAASYPGRAYIHQGWLTDDHRYFYLNDELDELVGQTERTRTIVWDLAELDDPGLVGEYLGPSEATDHNLFIRGDRMYQANYRAGFRVVDISDREHPVEVGFFDTTPYEGNPAGFSGAWTAFPFFESGTVIVSSINEGLFVLRAAEARASSLARWSI